MAAIAAVQDGLVAALEAWSGLAGTSVSLGRSDMFPGGVALIVSDGADSQQELELTTGPAQLRRETVTATVLAVVLEPHRDYRSMRDRAFALLAEAEKAIMADPTLGGRVFDCRPERTRTRMEITERGRLVVVELDVRAIALLGTP